MDIAYDLWITLPRITFRGKYSLHLNLLLLDIKGKGNMQGFCGKSFWSVEGRWEPNPNTLLLPIQRTRRPRSRCAVPATSEMDRNL